MHLETIYMKCQTLFSGKSTKNIINMLFAKTFTQSAKY